MYQQYVDSNFTWTNFSLEEQNAILKAQRSNCHLDVSKLLSVYPNITPIHEAVKSSLIKIGYMK
jgi:hypothetical protein